MDDITFKKTGDKITSFKLPAELRDVIEYGNEDGPWYECIHCESFFDSRFHKVYEEYDCPRGYRRSFWCEDCVPEKYLKSCIDEF